MSSVHEGHRQRLKDRFLKNGLDDFETHNVLELLLFYAVPQRDTNELAHRLLKQFGSLSAIFNAHFDELCKVEGVGSNVATLIKMVPDLARRYLDDCDRKKVTLTTVDAIGEFLRPKFIGRTKEQIFLLCLNNKGGVAYGDFIIEGTIDSAPMYTRYILEIALRCSAVSVILAHNHPNGLPIPSNADLVATQLIYQALEVAKIKLIDHFIFAGSDFVSMRSSGFFTFQNEV